MLFSSRCRKRLQVCVTRVRSDGRERRQSIVDRRNRVSIPTKDIALADAVSPRGVHAYLAANGWKRLGANHGDTGDVYCLRDDETESVLVPSSKIYADYTTRLVQLAETVGRVENRKSSTVLADLSLTDMDLIRLTVPTSGQNCTIALSDGVKFLDEARKLLLAAACATSRPQRVFREGHDERAAAHVDKVRLGWAEPDCFAIRLLVPVEPSLTEFESARSCLPESEPFERRATRMLFSGLRASREATQQVDRGGDIRQFAERVDQGISANLCEALASLIGIGGRLDVTVSWSLTLRPPKGRSNERVVVSFEQSDVPVLGEAARILAENAETSATVD